MERIKLTVGRLGVGLDNIDTKYCYSKRIRLQPATGMNATLLLSTWGLVRFFNQKIPYFIKKHR